MYVLNSKPEFRSSTAATWALYALTQNPSAQKKLREELLSVPTDTPSMNQLSNLNYLDAVLREVLRLYTPIPNSIRVATKDDIIPLDTPFVDKNGVTRNSIKYVSIHQISLLSRQIFPYAVGLSRVTGYSYLFHLSIDQKRSGGMMRKNSSMFYASAPHAACANAITGQSDGKRFLKVQTKFQVSGEINSPSSEVPVLASVTNFRLYSGCSVSKY